MLSSMIPMIPLGEKPGYIPSGLACSTDVHHRNNHKDRYQAAMNNMGMERYFS